jgi:hypothetical protein
MMAAQCVFDVLIPMKSAAYSFLVGNIRRRGSRDWIALAAWLVNLYRGERMVSLF